MCFKCALCRLFRWYLHRNRHNVAESAPQSHKGNNSITLFVGEFNATHIKKTSIESFVEFLVANQQYLHWQSNYLAIRCMLTIMLQFLSTLQMSDILNKYQIFKLVTQINMFHFFRSAPIQFRQIPGDKYFSNMPALACFNCWIFFLPLLFQTNSQFCIWIASCISTYPTKKSLHLIRRF